jgi:hypothetical protein
MVGGFQYSVAIVNYPVPRAQGVWTPPQIYGNSSLRQRPQGVLAMVINACSRYVLSYGNYPEFFEHGSIVRHCVTVTSRWGYKTCGNCYKNGISHLEVANILPNERRGRKTMSIFTQNNIIGRFTKKLFRTLVF